MRYFLSLATILLLQPAFADRITLKNGDIFHGHFFGATSQEIRFVVDEKLRLFPVNEVRTIEFGDLPEESPAPAGEMERAPAAKPPSARGESTAPTDPDVPSGVASDESTSSGRPSIRKNRRPTAGETSAPRTAADTGANEDSTSDPSRETAAITEDFVLPFGTLIDVRLTEEIDSSASVSGRTFNAELINPIVVGGRTMVERGALATVRASEEREPDYRNESHDVLALELTSVVAGGQRIPVRTNQVTLPLSGNRRDRALDTLGRAGRELGTILGGQTGRTAGSTAEDTTDIARRGQISRGTKLQFRLEDEVRPQVVDAGRFTE